MRASLPTTAEVLARLNEALAGLAPTEVVAAYAFGSVARGAHGAESDIDVGLLYAVAPAPTLLAQPFQLEAELSHRLGMPVQCVVMNTAPVELVHRIMAAQTLLFDHDPSFRIRFEVKARNAYFDLKPILDRYRQVGPTL